ncbi:MAG: hypothetical protein HN842_02750 [Gammaproteobacteria bacterium]|mgnify:CR=1 FL=1|jgi:hypothetical protein|nr:hypothetical protein [Gammaproteobacteria bacterium]
MCIQDKSMLISMKFTMIGQTKKDTEVTDLANNTAHAQKEAGRYVKNLYAKNALKEVNSAKNAIRELWVQNSSPWGEDGQRIMPSALYASFSADYRRMRADWEIEVTRFIQLREELIEEAKIRLGDMFDNSLYPTQEEMEERFDIEVSVNPVPDGDDFRIEAADIDSEEIKTQINSQVKERTSEITTDLFKRLHGVVNNMHERLTIIMEDDGEGSRKKSFKDSLVGNIQDLVSVLPELNLNKDPNIARLTEEVRKKLLPEPNELRNNYETLRDTQRSAEAILDDMSAFMGTA